MKNKLTITICALLSALAVFSCDNPIALGKKLNMDPPVVIIDKPDFMQNISGNIEITGTATDLEEIVAITVSIERIGGDESDWRREWRAERGRWMGRSSASASWESSENEGDWSQQGKKGNILWSVGTSMAGAPSGEYLITAGAENNVKNAGAKVTRRVVIDKDPPVVTVFTPVLDSRQYVEFTSSVYGYRLKDATILDKIQNKWIRIQYEVKDNYSLAELSFQLADNHGNFYYNKEGKPVEILAWSGKIEIHGDDIKDPTDWVEGTYDKPGTGAPRYLQILSRASDRAGNWSDGNVDFSNTKYRNHGWLVWWPEADKPWTEGIGTDDTTMPSDNVMLQYASYPGTDIHGQTYDNDGVARVEYQLYKVIPTNMTGDTKYEDKVVLTNPPLIAGTAPSSPFAWSFAAPSDSSLYRIEVDCWDMYGTQGHPYTAWFFVMDMDAPNVIVESPLPDRPLFGDADGSFTIEGYAEDGKEAVKLALVWLRDPDSRFDYNSVDFAGTPDNPLGGWDKATLAGAEDSKGNKLWVVSLNSIDVNGGTPGRVSKKFTKTLNLFGSTPNSLGIGRGPNNAPLNTQSFIFRVENAIPASRAVTQSWSPQGDSVPPTLDITGIKVARPGGLTETYHIKNGKLYDAAGTTELQVMNVLKASDTITISGTWGDDSLEVWRSGNWAANTRMGFLTVTWNGVPTPENTTALLSNGTWSAGFTVSADAAMQGNAYINATLEDFKPNKTEKSVSVKVSTDIPIILSISSTSDDGVYNEGKVINIYLEFNKPVEWVPNSGTPTASPRLKLNSSTADIYAIYQPGNLDFQHFTYTVQGGHSTEGITDTNGRLTVSSIDATNGVWRNNGDAAPAIPARNLANTKNIRIDTTAPTITHVQSTSGSPLPAENHYNAGKTVILRVLFNETITYTPGTGTAQLTLNTIPVATLTNPTLTSGGTALQFTYIVAANHNTPQTGTFPNTAIPLAANLFSLTGTARIADQAGNNLVTVPAPSIPLNINAVANSYTGRNIYIDTVVPSGPTLDIKADDESNEAASSKTITITGNEPNPQTFEYRVSANGGSTWSPPWSTLPSGGRTISASGNYTVQARQIDKAGNISTALVEKTFSIVPPSPLLQGYGGTTTGTYRDGETITININLNDAVTVAGSSTPQLSLTLNNGKTATLISGSGSSTLKFEYEVGSTPVENTSLLKIESINISSGVTIMKGSNNVTEQLVKEVAESITNNRGLDYYTKIKIDNTIPELRQISYTGLTATGSPVITLRFNKEIQKGSGNITIEYATPAEYRAPAVMDKATYDRYGGDAALGAYYEEGTNGTDNNGNWFTENKYILKYDFATSGITGSTPALIKALTDRNADKVVVSVDSSVVTRVTTGTGADNITNNSLRITLGGNAATTLPVRGIIYAITYLEGLVVDGQNHKVETLPSSFTDSTFLLPGVNTPYVRIQKKKETRAAATTQPMIAQVKMDCQTPSDIRYGLREVAVNQATSGDNNRYNGTNNPPRPTVTLPNSSITTPYSTAFEIGNDGNRNGYLYFFWVRATGNATGNTTNYTESYEKAARSVITFELHQEGNGTNATIRNWSTLRTLAGGDLLQLWIRGGDQRAGANLTPGFPLTWDGNDYVGKTADNPSGARLMTHVGNYNNGFGQWYWVTWEVTARPAYFHFIAGSISNNNIHLGPEQWSWGKNTWAFQYDKYPLYPGGNLYFQRDTKTTSDATDEYDFYTSFGGSRAVNP
jgi:hypothetical protein